jgi:hypothetical protein
MTEKWKENKGLLAHAIILLLFLVYILSADFLFDDLILLNSESTLQNIEVPHETGDIRYYIDEVSNRKIVWKEVISIIGWAFVEGRDATNSTKRVVLRSEQEVYVFDTYVPMPRPDVTRHFKGLKLDLDASGFQSNIPASRLNDGVYNIGIIITQDDKTSLVWTSGILEKSGEKVYTK